MPAKDVDATGDQDDCRKLVQRGFVKEGHNLSDNEAGETYQASVATNQRSRKPRVKRPYPQVRVCIIGYWLP